MSSGSFKTFSKGFSELMSKVVKGFDKTKINSLTDITKFLKNIDIGSLNPKALDELSNLRKLQKRGGEVFGKKLDRDFAEAMDDLASGMITNGKSADIARNADNFGDADVAALGKRMDDFDVDDQITVVNSFNGKKKAKLILITLGETKNADTGAKLLADPAIRNAFIKKSKEKGSGFERFADGLDTACRRMPTGCTIGKGVLYTGTAAGLSIAAYKFVDAVFLDDDDKQECVKACLPVEIFDSDAPGAYGEIPYKDLDFLTYDQLSEAYGAEFDQNNQPLCNSNTKDCIGMCKTRCGELHKTLIEEITKAATDPIKDLGKDTAEAASGTFEKFLEGLGFSLPGFFGIVIAVIVIIIISTMM